MAEDSALRQASLRYAEYYGDVRRHLVGEHSAEVRWSTASLFALNGGALAFAGQLENQNLFFMFAVLSFWLGILTSFVFVGYSQTKTCEFIANIMKLEELYILQAATGSKLTGEIEQFEAKKNEISTAYTPYLSYASFGFFSLGLALLGFAR
ncbi:hypothetical protein EH31_16315 [Erythrobacter longus]|uniref:SMODS and SLOG-associating 2TM effector domain-containing protein n=1 Tax=Erythrobacter longus TaxID=1044 RepID=A0A074M5D2_ERYLO|nr:hypothetical protein [Erythrobacter longus]KEO88524.1 hypothetical protein EH31_16315 [Erythrobacter longus]